MKILTKNIVSSILKVGIITSLLASLMLMGVDLFSHLETYTEYQVSKKNVLFMTLLYFPESFLTALGPSFLFAVTYYLSMLHANNEIIAVYNSGINYKKVISPCLILAVCISSFFILFNETVAINSTNKKDAMLKEITRYNPSKSNNYQIALADSRNGYLMYADEYIDSKKALFYVSLIYHGNETLSRINAYRAHWDDEKNNWIFHDCTIYSVAEDQKTVKIDHAETYSPNDLYMPPELFRNLSAEVSKMDLHIAYNYIRSIKPLNPAQYAKSGTEFYKRIFSCLTPLVMMIIACCMNYRFKKNVLFFSIICSLCIAVVYYVIQMMTMMLSNQGVLAPYWGTLLPFIVIIILAQLESLFIKE